MLSHDYDLKNSEIHGLSSADSLTGMFTALGYDTSKRLTQTPDALGLPETLAREVVKIERLANQEDGGLQVFLLEMKHVTVAMIQILARVFKNRAGLFLFVLTTLDYERLDFVLMEQAVPETQSTREINSPQVTLRPRILSVDRRNPDPVSMRVLRRFSYTELDADYQWDKLHSAYGVADWSEPLFNNRALFSDYYLNERLPQRFEWKEDPRPVFGSISYLFADVRKEYAGKVESQVRSGLLEPTLKALGWGIEQSNGSKDESPKPDYWLKTPSGEMIPCLAYAWDRTLDGMDDKRDADTPSENPAQMVVSILEKMAGNALGWAIVTNGKTWRLYSARAHSRATNYYEIDLEETLASPEAGTAFRYFWLLFRAKSFSGQPCFVESLLTESASYAKALGDRLKGNVFENVFPKFAEGFVREWGKPAVELTSEELDETFHATLTFLYRLLFLLYAEARDLLPVKETRGFWEISLSKMRQEIAGKAGNIADLAPEKLKAAYSASETSLYDRLGMLFVAIDQGEAKFNVPVYNGGLFVTEVPAQSADEPAEVATARFLKNHKISDRFLALGLDLLARDIDEKTQALAMIDYKSLGVRQLGSIYEGLLEFKVRVATEKMAVVTGKKGEEILPYKEAEAKNLKVKTTGKGAARTEFVIHKGELYLENDKHERKASGSYYTPDYIVKYIVQNTVGPALDAKLEGLRPKLREAQKAYHAAVERQKAFQKMGQKGDDPEKTAYTFRALVDDLFDLRVLDPAMGSGHFLVEAVDFITDRLLAFLNAFPWNPVTATLRQTRGTILEQMRAQEISIDPARLTDVNLLKRHVLKRCIYGVDLNPMAVELAKVSLWLDCFTLGAPLSFLDHHLKPGNSLIGARIEEVRAALEMAVERERLEIPLLMGVMGGSQFAGVMMSVDLMRRVGELPDTTAEQVHKSRAEYRKATDALAPYKRILDVYTSRWFGNPDTKLDQPAISFLRNEHHLPWIQFHAELETLKPASQLIAETALKAARKEHFFHWELEFPEVFFGPSPASQQQIVMKENPGFDVVVGNPPYLNAWTMTEQMPQERDAINNIFYKTNLLEGHWDLYVPFVIQSLFLTKPTGYHSFIVPNPILREKYGVSLREQILTDYFLTSILSFGHANVFDEVSRQCVVYSISKRSQKKRSQSIRVATGAVPFTYSETGNIDNNVWLDAYNYQIRVDEAYIRGTPLLAKVQLKSDFLGQYLYVNVGATVSSKKPGAFTKKDVVSNAPTGNAKKFFDGSDMSRYSIDWKDSWLDYRRNEMSGPRSPEMFETEKILVRIRTAENERLIAFYDDTKMYCDHTVIVCCSYNALSGSAAQSDFDGYEKKDFSINTHYVLSLINSTFMSWVFRNKFATGALQGSYSDVWPQSVRAFPVRRISFTTPATRREALVREAQALIAAKNAPALVAFSATRLSAQPEQSDVIHDLLAALAERMIDLNKQKQAEVKRFLAWLENLLKVNVDDLNGKSKLKNYLGDYQKGEPETTYAELEDILYKNKGKLAISLNDSRVTAKLREEYEKSLAVLRPIKASLAWTDEVIDQVVYQLYGLTEEEIRVVEGK